MANTEQEKDYWQKVLYHCRVIFSANPKVPPPISGVEYAPYFKSQNHKPFHRPPPRCTREYMEYMDSTWTWKNGIVGFGDSEWATVPGFAKKKPDPVTGIAGIRTAADF